MNETTLPNRRCIRWIAYTATFIASLALLMSPVAAAGSENGVSHTPHAHSVLSVVHILGVVSSLLLGFYGYRARQRFKGGVLAGASKYVVVGALLFALAFLVEELDHGLNINVFESVGDMQLQMGLSMLLFTGTVFAFGWAFYRIISELKEWYS